MFNIPDVWKQILNALIAAPVAWQSPRQIALALGWDVDETTDLLSAMDLAGWIATWEVEPALVVTLSPLAAHRLSVELIEFGPEEIPRWSSIGEPSTDRPRVSDMPFGGHGPIQDNIDEAMLPPDLLIERAETVARRAARYRQKLVETADVGDLPPPCHFLGQNLTPWPGPAVTGLAESCPVCAGRPLSPHVYCLYCDRWGLDTVLEILVARSAKPKSNPSSKRTNPNQATSSDTTESPRGPKGKPKQPGSSSQFGASQARRKFVKRLRRKARAAKR
jgi:hypothetical protein